MLGGFVFGASILDKCRADLLGIGGDHHFTRCALGTHFWKFTGLDPEVFRAFVGTGANDEEVGEWIERNAAVQDRATVIRWNFQMISNLAFASRFAAAVGIPVQAATSQRSLFKPNLSLSSPDKGGEFLGGLVGEEGGHEVDARKVIEHGACHLLGDGDTLHAPLRALESLHSRQDRPGDRDAGHLVVQEEGLPSVEQGPYSHEDRYS